MNKLKLMGIQQWRRRADSTVPDMPQVDSDPVSIPIPELSESQPKYLSEAKPELETRPTAEADPVPNQELIQSGQEATPVEEISNDVATVPEQKVSWDSLKQAITDQAGCQHCATAEPMLGAGDQQADSVFIVSTPSANDMQRQQLLSGRDGQLFDGMLRAMSLTREQVYLTSACKCVVGDESVSTRPCIQLVHQQLALIQPKVIVTFGQQAAQWVIKSNEYLPVLRAQAQQCHNTNTPVVVTHGLTQLLAQPGLKAEAWQDLKNAIRLLGAANMA